MPTDLRQDAPSQGVQSGGIRVPYWQFLFLHFEGRIGRQDFWIGQITLLLISLIVLAASVFWVGNSATGVLVGRLIATILLIGPSIAIGVKRCHDRDKSGAWLLLTFIPFIGLAWYLIELGCLPGTEGPNRYDAVPSTAPARPRETAGFIRGPQNFVAGLTLIGIALFAIWAISNLPQGTLRAMGPAMLPRWLAIGVGLCGVALAVIGLLREGDGLRPSDYSPIAAIGAVLILSAVIAYAASLVVSRPELGTIFGYVFLVLFYGAVLYLFVMSFARSDWLAATGLRGPFFVVAGILAFAITIRMFGLVIAGPLAMVIGGFGTPEVREKEILIFAAVMTAFCVGLFRYLLNLPIPILIIPGVVHI